MSTEPNPNCPIKCESMAQCSGICDFLEPDQGSIDIQAVERDVVTVNLMRFFRLDKRRAREVADFMRAGVSQDEPVARVGIGPFALTKPWFELIEGKTLPDGVHDLYLRPQGHDGPPLIGRWHHGNGALVSGSVRIAMWDCDTNPPAEFRDRMMDWMCATLNAAVTAHERSAPDEFDAPPKIPENCGTGYCSCIECFKTPGSGEGEGT